MKTSTDKHHLSNWLGRRKIIRAVNGAQDFVVFSLCIGVVGLILMKLGGKLLLEAMFVRSKKLRE